MKILTTLFVVLFFSVAAFAQNTFNSNPCITQYNNKETCLVIAKDFLLVLNQNKEERGLVYSSPRMRNKGISHKLQLGINTTKMSSLILWFHQIKN